MAKKRKSIFDTDLAKGDIKKEAQEIEKKALTGKEKKKEGKLMHLYVDEEHHRQAKIKAVQMGMKLGQYIEWLIEQHEP